MSHLDVYLGQAPEHMVAATFASNRAAEIVTRFRTPGLEELHLVEDRPSHIDADWAALAARGIR